MAILDNFAILDAKSDGDFVARSLSATILAVHYLAYGRAGKAVLSRPLALRYALAKPLLADVLRGA